MVEAVIKGTVGHVVPEYLPRSATFVYTLLRFQRRFQPVVFTHRTANLREFPLGRVHELATEQGPARRCRRRVKALASGYAQTYQHWIAQEAGRESCVALHAHFGWSGTAAFRAATRLRIPLVTTFYGRDISDPERGRQLRHPHRRLFTDGTLFVCEGTVMAQQLRDQGCPHDRIRIVRIGLDLSLWPFRPPRRSRPFIVLQAGRFWEKKGIDLSLRAFAAARHRLGPSELWLVGDGPLRADLESLADRLGIASEVRFLGMVSYSDYQDVLDRAHVCLQPSRTARDGDTEGGAPTVLLEMQATGIPIVATRHADIPFVVPNPDGLVEEEDVGAIAEALIAVVEMNEEERHERATRGRVFVEKRHEASSVAREIEAIYEEALLLQHNEKSSYGCGRRGGLVAGHEDLAPDDVVEPAQQSP